MLGLLYNRKKDEVPAEVTELVEKRAAAKKAKDWATADAIRAQLTELGWAVKDTAQGPQLQGWRNKDEKRYAEKYGSLTEDDKTQIERSIPIL